MDTMTFTKVTAALCGSLLVFLLGGWLAESIYHGGEAHGDEYHQAYTIPVEGDDHGEAEEAVAEVPFEELYAAADPAEGEKVWRNCRACHALEEGKNGTGPYLYGVVGRPVDAVEGFRYSGALEQVVDVWTPENLFHFLENPKEYAPGTAMGYSGLRDPVDRANLIAYLDSLDD